MPTARLEVTDADWTDLGTASLFIQALGGAPVYIAINPTKPSTADLSTSIILGGREGESGSERGRDFNIGPVTGQRVYARTEPGKSVSLIVCQF